MITDERTGAVISAAMLVVDQVEDDPELIAVALWVLADQLGAYLPAHRAQADAVKVACHKVLNPVTLATALSIDLARRGLLGGDNA